jgi:hypothetical protein
MGWPSRTNLNAVGKEKIFATGNGYIVGMDLVRVFMLSLPNN